MEILNKIMPLILTAIMSVNLSGCGNTGTNGSQPAETSSATIVTDENGNKFATAADFSKVTICGTEFTMPCKASDFTGDFSVSDKPTNENDTWYAIYYKDVPVGSICYKTESKINFETSIPSIILLWTETETISYSVDGIDLPTTYDEVIKHFGTPNKELISDIYSKLFYNTEEINNCSCVVLSGKSNDCIDSISFMFEKE